MSIVIVIFNLISIYAHGQNELRPKSSVSTPYSNSGANSNGLSSSTMAGHPRYKTSMCIAFAKNGFCDKSSGKKRK